ncbi:B- and T-lymphocyte attenuator isoform X1 [Aquila chrysaetos chrysaetos]|uniref:B- and T-lymphocyte attenuator isoform X1 n=1 Tax=Aquila chrysaetos chrysaetos TaxID=223781 RepID=UPI0005D046D7|nr:B- and T-lymphocyte attenuator isoform X1 [Aquila chrysaetos chrysaetos]XP_040980690.1 B- and T-lymphocyte attenuator isoform X1 [Aquila chrysaetos chrysaetos]
MKGPPLMLIKTILLYILLVMLAESNHQVHGFDATSCAVEIQVKRHSQYKIHVGNSLTIGCPVRYCKEKPVMHWCKMEVERCVQLKVGKTEWKSNVFTLEVFSIHQNDSGLYRCRAIADNLSSESHGIQVIVEEKSANIITISPENTTSISEESQGSGNYKILHIIYASASVGLCCPFIVVCMFWCLRRYHARQKRTPLTQQRKESLVRSPAAAGTTEASEESCSLYYCSMASPMQALHGNTVYDNDVPPWNAQRTAPNAPRNDPVTPSIPVLLESPDVLTYAALNHSASAERCQRRELTVENEFTEYASINVNK